MGVFAQQLEVQLDREWSDYVSDKAYQRAKDMRVDPRTDGSGYYRSPDVTDILRAPRDNHEGAFEELSMAFDPRKEDKGKPKQKSILPTLAIFAVLLGGSIYAIHRWA